MYRFNRHLQNKDTSLFKAYTGGPFFMVAVCVFWVRGWDGEGEAGGFWRI